MREKKRELLNSLACARWLAGWLARLLLLCNLLHTFARVCIHSRTFEYTAALIPYIMNRKRDGDGVERESVDPWNRHNSLCLSLSLSLLTRPNLQRSSLAIYPGIYTLHLSIADQPPFLSLLYLYRSCKPFCSLSYTTLESIFHICLSEMLELALVLQPRASFSKILY